jgi:hypothetical protein
VHAADFFTPSKKATQQVTKKKTHTHNNNVQKQISMQLAQHSLAPC